jgi:dihydroflavonol-4-reductase
MTSPQKILVTGATGLVGSHLLYVLWQKGYAIRALYRHKGQIDNCAKTLSFYEPEPSKIIGTIEWIKGDVCDYYSLLDAMQNVVHVYHCAAMVSFDPREKKQMFLVNEEGTANVVNACLEAGVQKLCYVSTIGTLGKPVNGNLIDEETAWQNDDDHSQYSLSKFKAEMEVWRGSKEGLKTVVVNPGVIIGPGDTNRSSGALFGRVMHGLKYYTNGITGFVDVRNVVGFMAMLMESELDGDRYVLVSENLSYKELMANIAQDLSVPAPKTEATRLLTGLAWRSDKLMFWLFRKKPSFTRENARTSHAKSFYSAQKAIEQFNYTFIPIKQSIAETAQWLKQ